MPEGHRIVIATPCGDSLSTVYASSLSQVIMRTLGRELPKTLEDFAVQFYGSSILPAARNRLARYAVEEGFTHLLFIDSDMEFPSDLILRMMKHDAPIVGANCVSRRPPYRTTAQSAPGIGIPTNPDSTGLEKVIRVGTGVMWMHTDVLRAIPKPWFEFRYIGGDDFYGEDYFFCEKARNAGFEILVDHDLSKLVKHHGTFGYGPLAVSALHAQAREEGR